VNLEVPLARRCYNARTVGSLLIISNVTKQQILTSLKQFAWEPSYLK
jgi:hypothetical protein